MTTAKTLEPSKKFEAIEFPSKKNEHWRFGAPKNSINFGKITLKTALKQRLIQSKLKLQA